VETSTGSLVRDAQQLRHGERLRLRFAQGEAAAVVTEAPVEQGSLF